MLGQFCERGCRANKAACLALVALQSRLFADVRILHVVVTTHRCAIQQKARRSLRPEAFRVDRTILLLAYFLAAIEANVYLTHERQERVDPPLKKIYSCVYLRHKGGSHDKEWHH